MTKKIGYVSLEKFQEKVPNKYFGVVIASKESRRINYIRYLERKRAKEEENVEYKSETVKPIIEAIDKLLNGELDEKIKEYTEKTGIADA